MKSDRAISHCAREVRRHDHDRYLCAMFADAAARKRLFALYALNLELARIAELVSEPADFARAVADRPVDSWWTGDRRFLLRDDLGHFGWHLFIDLYRRASVDLSRP